MTREEMAGWAAEQAETWKEQAAEEEAERGGGTGLAYATAHHAYFDAIAAELSKTCISCGSFSVVGYGVVGKCAFWKEYVAVNGEGHCHMWESKPAGKAQD